MSGSPLASSLPIAGSRSATGLTERWIEASQNLSLDIVAGVVCAAAFAASAAGAAMPLAWWVALSAATFVVYAVDHLLDVRGSRPVLSDRRRLHRRFAPLGTGPMQRRHIALPSGAFGDGAWVVFSGSAVDSERRLPPSSERMRPSVEDVSTWLIGLGLRRRGVLVRVAKARNRCENRKCT